MAAALSDFVLYHRLLILLEGRREDLELVYGNNPFIDWQKSRLDEARLLESEVKERLEAMT